jgi:hypothetical protein
MTVPEMVKTRFTLVEVLEKALAIGACLVFLGSIAFPFYKFMPSVMYFPGNGDHPIEYLWAYKLRTEYLLRTHQPEEFWFDSYWSRQTTTRYDNLQLVLPSMLVAQIVTVAAAIASIVWRRRILTLIPVIGCSIVIALMMSANMTLSTENALVVDTVQIGYWLAYPALGLFILRFLLTLKPRQP